MLIERASGSMSKSVLAAFVSSLNEYESELIKALTYAGREITSQREENDLLRSLVGLSEQHVQAKILSQGEELRFLRDQMLALKKELDQARKANDDLKLETEQQKSEIAQQKRLREQDQNTFKEELDKLHQQLKTMAQKFVDKQLEFRKAKETMAREFQEKEKMIYGLTEDEMRSVSVMIYNSCQASLEAIGESIADLQKVKPPEPPPPKKKLFGFSKPPSVEVINLASEVLPLVQLALQHNQQAGDTIQRYLKVINFDETTIVKVNWNRIWSEMKHTFTTLASRVKAKVSWPPENAALPAFFSDEKAIREICQVLVQNGIESLGQESTFEISMQFVEDSMIIRFADTGCGVKAEDAGKIFLPFFTTKPGHYGLGLSRAQRLVKRIGGMLVYESRGVGSLFVVSLPGQKPSLPLKPTAGK